MENNKKPLVWIVHNNCSRKCSHCVCNPNPINDISDTEKLANDLKRQNLEVNIYATNQTHDDLAKLYSEGKHNCLVVGHKANQNLINSLKELKEIVFSLHGPNAEIHELLAPSGDFETTLKSIKKAKHDNTIDIGVSCVIHSKNYLLLEEMCQLFYSMNASNVHFIKLSYIGRATDLPADFFLSKEQFSDFLKNFYQIRSKFNDMKLLLGNNWGPQFSKLQALLFQITAHFSPEPLCNCGISEVAINPGSKEVYPCRFTLTIPELKMGYFDPEKGLVLTDNWHLNLEKLIGEPCKSCKIYKKCNGGCRGHAIAEKKRLTGTVDIYTGNDYCAVAMGITKWINEENYYSLTRRVKQIPAKIKALLSITA